MEDAEMLADVKAYDAARARLERKTGSVRTWKRLGTAVDVNWDHLS